MMIEGFCRGFLRYQHPLPLMNAAVRRMFAVVEDVLAFIIETAVE
jgi:hypothetical protein